MSSSFVLALRWFFNHSTHLTRRRFKINNQRKSEAMDNNKLNEHELLKRLDNEFDDVDFEIRESATKGVVATVSFYEKKINSRCYSQLAE